MTERLPDGRRGQCLAIALGLVVASAVWVGVVTPILEWNAELPDRLEQREAMASRMAGLAATLPALQAEAAAGTTGQPPPSAVLEGKSDTIAGAALQQLVQQMASDARTSVSSVEQLPTEAVGSYRRIALRVTVAGPWPALMHLLQAIEQANPRMLVDDLRLHGSPLPGVALPMDTTFTVLAVRNGPAS